MEEVNSRIASMQEAVANCVRLFEDGSGSPPCEPAVRLRVEVEPLTLKRKRTTLPHQRNSSLMHSAPYENLPECIKAAFDERIDARIVPKAYKKSEQTRYGAVSEQSGTKGIVEGMFQVEVTVPGTTQHTRLGRVSDTRMGAFLWCANFVDKNLHDGHTLAMFLEKILHGKDFAEAWLGHVRERIPMIQKVGSSRIVNQSSCPLTANLPPPKKQRVTEALTSPAKAVVTWSAVLSNLVEASPIAAEQHKFLNDAIQLYYEGHMEKQELFDLFVHQFGKEVFSSAILKVRAQEQKRVVDEAAE